MFNQQSNQLDQEIHLRRIYRWIVLDILTMYLVGAFLYADPFHFWSHALSEIGTTKTLLGTPNMPSALIVMSGMFVAARMLLKAARIYLRNNIYPNQYRKAGLLYIASLGAFISISPNDLFHLIHTIGSALLIGSVFLITLLMVWECREIIDPRMAYSIMSSLGITILAYTVTYFSDLEIKQAPQKLCLANLLIVLYQRSRISPYLETLIHSEIHMGLNNT